ncbi:MAG: single-stranded DNA-binding protein [Lachnospiraceae bacterium]|nr:single-stranded DNA-binding protein [Lachnospiraceae bacterium]
MNKVILMGRLTRDPDIRHTQGENSMVVARYTLAVDRRFRRDGADQSADFISCVSFGKQAEFIEKYVHKGTKIAMTGRIQTGSYTNKDGQKVYTTDVVAEEVEFAESKRAADSYDGGSSYGAPMSNSQPAPQAADDGFMNVPDGIDEELPFG